MVRRVIGGVAALGLGGCVLMDNPHFDGPVTTSGSSSGDASSSADTATSVTTSMTTGMTTGMTMSGGSVSSVTSVGSSMGTVDPVTGGTTETTGGAGSCGDGVLDAAEECDDGNAKGLDGCSALCHVEPQTLVVQDSAVLGPFGGMPGQGPFSMACPEGQVMTEFGAYLDAAYMNAICKPTGSCAKISITPELQIALSPDFVGAYFGNCLQGVAPFSSLCPPDAALVGFRGTALAQINSITPRCATVSLVESADGFAVEVGAAYDLLTYGGGGGMDFGPVDCPPGLIMTQFKGDAADGLHNLTIVCTEFVPP